MPPAPAAATDDELRSETMLAGAEKTADLERSFLGACWNIESVAFLPVPIVSLPASAAAGSWRGLSMICRPQRSIQER